MATGPYSKGLLRGRVTPEGRRCRIAADVQVLPESLPIREIPDAVDSEAIKGTSLPVVHPNPSPVFAKVQANPRLTSPARLDVTGRSLSVDVLNSDFWRIQCPEASSVIPVTGAPGTWRVVLRVRDGWGVTLPGNYKVSNIIAPLKNGSNDFSPPNGPVGKILVKRLHGQTQFAAISTAQYNDSYPPAEMFFEFLASIAADGQDLIARRF